MNLEIYSLYNQLINQPNPTYIKSGIRLRIIIVNVGNAFKHTTYSGIHVNIIPAKNGSNSRIATFSGIKAENCLELGF
jgi:hypothetical protein